MSLTLSNGATSVTLNPSLLWSDEFWSPVAQSLTRTVTGAALIQVRALTGGRPITLQPEDDDSGWIERSVLDQLKAWADVPGLEMTLTGLRDETRTLVWRHEEGAIEASPVIHFEDVEPGDFYRATLRFLQV